MLRRGRSRGGAGIRICLRRSGRLGLGGWRLVRRRLLGIGGLLLGLGIGRSLRLGVLLLWSLRRLLRRQAGSEKK